MLPRNVVIAVLGGSLLLGCPEASRRDPPAEGSSASSARQPTGPPTVRNVLKQRRLYDGKLVTITGWVRAELTCTRAHCPGECCNTCWARFLLRDGGKDRASPGLELADRMATPHSCTGNECSWQDECPHKEGQVEVKGEVMATAHTVFLRVREVKPVK